MNTAEVRGRQTDGADLNHLDESAAISIQFLRILIKLMKRGQREMKRMRKNFRREEGRKLSACCADGV
jgi:hypothetical protein